MSNTRKNIFVLGLDQFNLDHNLSSVKDAEKYRFHELLARPIAEVQGKAHFPVRHLMDEAVRRLDEFSEPIDAIIGYWDFPVSLMAPILCRRMGLSGPSVEAAFKCEHKYWSRIEQSQATDTCPQFDKVDPYDSDALAKIRLPFPFWIKPVKAYLAQLAYRIRTPQDFVNTIPIIREKIPRMSRPFNYLLQYPDLPAEMKEVDGRFLVAEQDVTSTHQCTVEGYVHEGNVRTHGVVDSICYPGTSVFQRLQYPSTLPAQVCDRMEREARKVLRHIGYDNGAFNVEFFWNQHDDSLWLLEINARISQSHGDAFHKVDGRPNHEVTLDIALGRQPQMPHRQGKYGIAAKFMLRHFEDGVVVRAPGAADVARAQLAVPDTLITIEVREGDRLSSLHNQDAYSYLLAELFIGGQDEADLLRRYERCLAHLPFEVRSVRREAG